MTEPEEELDLRGPDLRPLRKEHPGWCCWDEKAEFPGWCEHCVDARKESCCCCKSYLVPLL